MLNEENNHILYSSGSDLYVKGPDKEDSVIVITKETKNADGTYTMTKSEESTTYYRMCTIGDIVEKFYILSPKIYDVYKDCYRIPQDIERRCPSFSDIKNSKSQMSVVMVVKSDDNPEELVNFNISDYYNDELVSTKDQYLYQHVYYIVDPYLAERTIKEEITFIYKDVHTFKFNGNIGQLLPLKKREVYFDSFGDVREESRFLYEHGQNANLCRLEDIECVYNTFNLTVELQLITIDSSGELLNSLYTIATPVNGYDVDDMRNAEYTLISHTSYTPYIHQYKITGGNAFKIKMNSGIIAESERIKFVDDKWVYRITSGSGFKRLNDKDIWEDCPSGNTQKLSFEFDKYIELKDIDSNVKITITPKIKQRTDIFIRVNDIISGCDVTVVDVVEVSEGNFIEIPIINSSQKSASYKTSYYNPSVVNFKISFDKKYYKRAEVIWMKADDENPIHGNNECTYYVIDKSSPYNEGDSYIGYVNKDKLNENLSSDDKFTSYTLLITMVKAYVPFFVDVIVEPISKLQIGNIVYKYIYEGKEYTNPLIWDSDNHCWIESGKSAVFGALSPNVDFINRHDIDKITNIKEFEAVFEQVNTILNKKYDTLEPALSNAGRVYYKGKYLMQEEDDEKLYVKFLTEPIPNFATEIPIGWKWKRSNRYETLPDPTGSVYPLPSTDTVIIGNVVEGQSFYFNYQYDEIAYITVFVKEDTDDIQVLNARGESVIYGFDEHNLGGKQVTADSSNTVSLIVNVKYSVRQSDYIRYVFSDGLNETSNIVSGGTKHQAIIEFTNLVASNKSYRVTIESYRNYVKKNVIVTTDSVHLDSTGYLCRTNEKYEGVYLDPFPVKVLDGSNYKWTYNLEKGVVIPMIFTLDNKSKVYAGNTMTAAEYYTKMNVEFTVKTTKYPYIPNPSTEFDWEISGWQGSGSGNGRLPYESANKKSRIKKSSNDDMVYGITSLIPGAGPTFPGDKPLIPNMPTFNYTVKKLYHKQDENKFIVEFDFNDDPYIYEADVVNMKIILEALSATTYYVEVSDATFIQVYVYTDAEQADDTGSVTKVDFSSGKTQMLEASVATPFATKFRISSINNNIFNTFNYEIKVDQSVVEASKSYTIDKATGYKVLRYDALQENMKFIITPTVVSRRIFVKVIGGSTFDISVIMSGNVSVNASRSGSSVVYGTETTYTGNLSYDIHTNQADFTTMCDVKLFMSNDMYDTTTQASVGSWVKVDSIQVNKNSTLSYKYGWNFSVTQDIMFNSQYKSIMIEFSLPRSIAGFTTVSGSASMLELVIKENSVSKNTVNMVVSYTDGSYDLDKNSYSGEFVNSCSVYDENNNSVGTLQLSNPETYFSISSIATTDCIKFSAVSKGNTFLKNVTMTNGNPIKSNYVLKDFMKFKHNEAPGEVVASLKVMDDCKLRMSESYTIDNALGAKNTISFNILNGDGTPYEGSITEFDIKFSFDNSIDKNLNGRITYTVEERSIRMTMVNPLTIGMIHGLYTVTITMNGVNYMADAHIRERGWVGIRYYSLPPYADSGYIDPWYDNNYWGDNNNNGLGQTNDGTNHVSGYVIGSESYITATNTGLPLLIKNNQDGIGVCFTRVYNGSKFTYSASPVIYDHQANHFNDIANLFGKGNVYLFGEKIERQTIGGNVLNTRYVYMYCASASVPTWSSLLPSNPYPG